MNGPSNRTFVPVECLDCGEIVTTTCLASLLQGRCGCSCRSVKTWRWRRHEFEQLAENADVQVLCSESSWERHATTHWAPGLACAHCQGLDLTRTIGNFLQSGGHIECPCRARLWSNRGAELADRLAQTTYILTTTLGEHDKTGFVEIFCNKCGDTVSQSFLRLMITGRAPCKCWNINWKSNREYAQQLLDTIDISILTDDETWRQEARTNGVDGGWRPLLQCKRCEDIVAHVLLGTVIYTNTLSCACRSGKPWRCRYDDCVQHARKHDLIIDLSKEEWEQAGIRSTSQVPIQCTKCGVTARTTTLYNFLHKGTVACGCRNKTERFFLEDVRAHREQYPHQIELISDSPGYWQPHWALSRRDFGVRLQSSGEEIIEVNEEVDGRQHFLPVCFGGGDPSNPIKQAQLDGANCRAAWAAGVWVVRYFQEDVIAKRVDWQDYRRRAQQHIVENSDTCPKVIVPETSRELYELWAQMASIEDEEVIVL